jgi:hypothetical protein
MIDVGEKRTFTECEYCHKEIRKDEDFILEGKYPSFWKKWKTKEFPPDWFAIHPRPEDWGTIYHKSCFLEMIKNEVQK